MKEIKKERYKKRHHQTITALEKKKSKHPEYASRHMDRQASSIRSAALKTASATGQTMDSLLWELYDFDHSEWWLSDRELFTYDENGNMTGYVLFAYDTEVMEILPYDKEIVTYNAQGQATEILWQEWDPNSGQWINSGWYELSYHENGNLTRETISDWDPAGNQWLLWAQFDKTYNAEGKLSEELWFYWDEESALLVLTYKDELLYEDGKLTLWNEYEMKEGEWVMFFRTTYSYDGNGNLIYELTEVSDPESGMWFDYSSYSYTYNDKNQLIAEEVWEFDWTFFTLIQTWHYEYTWDNDGNMIEQVDRSWDAGVVKDTEEWLNAFKSEFFFNKDFTILDLYVPYWFLQNMDDINFVHMPVSELGYAYVEEDWAFDYRQTAYYSDFGGSSGTEEELESVIRIFPVPASETITFSWDDRYSSLSLEVYDLTGKGVISRSIHSNETIGMDQLPSGIYMYKLSDRNELIQSGKLSIE
jgi:hypothetical protein